ncbi:MAG TPA: energy transducer TonB, partial [Blastocatellia bacterium]
PPRSDPPRTEPPTQPQVQQPKPIVRSIILQGTAINRVYPQYPPLARTANVSGAVVVEVTIDEQGNVAAARVLSGHPLLRDVCLSAARAWKWRPTMLNGSPVKVIGTITFNFQK